MSSKTDSFSEYASPPCFAHELEYTADGISVVDTVEKADVARWRKAQREHLTGFRQALPANERHLLDGDIIDEIEHLIEPGPKLCVSVYWPYRGEPNLQKLMLDWHSKGARIALPVVVANNAPLIFREWTPGCAMERGVLKIPIPAKGMALTPDIVIAPLVGFDRQCYRLGYGGGFFDRTLASLTPRALAIGIGHPGLELETIYPQGHDIPMDIIITGKGQVLKRQIGRPSYSHE